MRYYDTAIKNEIHEQDPDKVPATAIPMTDARVSAFFEELMRSLTAVMTLSCLLGQAIPGVYEQADYGDDVHDEQEDGDEDL